MDTGKDDGGVGDAGCVASEFEAVTGEVGDVLDFPVHIEVCENGGIVFAFQVIDFLDQVERIFGGGG